MEKGHLHKCAPGGVWDRVPIVLRRDRASPVESSFVISCKYGIGESWVADLPSGRGRGGRANQGGHQPFATCFRTLTNPLGPAGLLRLSNCTMEQREPCALYNIVSGGNKKPLSKPERGLRNALGKPEGLSWGFPGCPKRTGLEF